jgi:hypothetical protein
MTESFFFERFIHGEEKISPLQGIKSSMAGNGDIFS